MRVADLVQEEVALKVGIDPSHLSRLLRGRRVLTPELATRIREVIVAMAPDEALA